MSVTSYTKATLDTLLAGKATPAQITTAITQLRTDLVNGAPGVLDTLSEIATALGNDSNLSATLTTAIAAKATPAQVQAAVDAFAVTVSATYVAVPPGGTNGQVLGLVGGVIVWVTPSSGGTTPTYAPLGTDTDGVAYYVPGAFVNVDTDGVPYYTATPTSSSKAVLADTDGAYYFAA